MTRTPAPLGALLCAIACAAAWAQSPAPVAPPPLSFAQAFEAALGNDPQFRAARFERESSQGNVPIARAALLPQVTLNASDSRTRGTREFPNSLNQQVTLNVDYGSPQASLQMRAPLFNYESQSRYRQALVQSDAADAVYRVRGNELIERLGVAYLQRLAAAESVKLAQMQIAALEGQRQRAEQRLQRGEGTRIELSEAQAQLDVARVRLLDAQDQVVVARRGLHRITGVDAAAVRDLPADFRPPPLLPQLLDDWLDLAAQRSPTVQARRQTVEVTRLGIQRNMAGHYPRLDAVASVSTSSNESLANLNQSSKLASVGLQLSIPLFSGFGVDAGVQQAKADLARTEAELSAERETVALEVQRQYLAVSNGSARIAALRQAASSMEVALEGVSRGVAAGLRTLAEVLDAQSRLFSARRDLAQARLDYLLARMRLQAQSGAPMADVVADIERLLDANS